MIERWETDARMSQGVGACGLLFLAGQVADDPVPSVREQTRQVLAEIDRVLALAGTDKTKLMSATVYLADIAGFADMNAEWDAWVAPGHAPARATVEARLAAPEYLVEIVAVAAR